MRSICCWLWSEDHAMRRDFRPEHVNALQRMLARHFAEPHQFICVSDKSNGLAKEVAWLETPAAAKEVGRLMSPEGLRFPSCYRRLWNFSEEAKVLGDRVLCIDIDLVAVNDITPVFDLMPQEFVGWRPYRDWGQQLRFGGGIYLLTPGTRNFVWDNFHGQRSINEARKAGYRGSDQAWISYMMRNKEEAYWPKDAGLYSVRDLDKQLTLPLDARIVQFNGNTKPWQSPKGWVVKNWSPEDYSG